jgi:two-component system, LytTR family, sensor kinase
VPEERTVDGLIRLAGMAVAIVLGWAAAGLFFATQNYTRAVTYDLAGELQTEVFGMLLTTFISALLTPFLLYVAEVAPVTSTNKIRPILQSLGPVVLFGVVRALFDAWSPTITDGGPLTRADFVSVAAATFHAHLLMGACVMTAANLLRARRENALRQLREKQIERDLSRAQLQLLQAQMQPHFLFNTLNAAAALLTLDRERSATTIFTLAELLRRSQQLGQQISIPISSEVAFLESYLALQKVRFPDRLFVRIVVDPATSGLAVPSLILQPLVENAILHGVIDRPNGGTVTIEIHRDGHDLLMEVRDDGPGADPGQIAAARGLGLANTRSRLECLFKDDFEMRFFRTAREFVARLIIPAVDARAILPRA